MLHITGTARLISDVHLQADEAAVTNRFAAFLADCARKKIAALFILGDLFEYWIGDDSRDDPLNARVVAQLRALSDQGTTLHVMHGNRDFLLGQDMMTACGATLLPDITKVSFGGTALLLLHGDTLCTDDIAYQQFRAQVRSTAWQTAFLARALDVRLAEVARLREHSRAAMQGKSAAIMDANPVALRTALEDAQCLRMIHGHTHRPGHDRIPLSGAIGERWVLSDWAATRADALEISADGSVSRLDLMALSL